MITKEQLKEKVTSMLKEAYKGMEKNIDRLIESNVADLEKFDNDYILPRMFMNALLREEQFQFKLLEPTRQEKKLMEQLYASL